MRYSNSDTSKHPFYDNQHITAGSGVKPASSDIIISNGMVEEGFLTVTH